MTDTSAGPDFSRSEDEVTALLRGCSAGDHAAFQRLYQRESSRLFGVALRITRQHQLAEDVLHDAFLQIWRNAARFDPSSGRPLAWMLAIVRYRALDLMRRAPRELAGESVPETVDPSPDALERMVGVRDGEALTVCLDRLQPERRALVIDAFLYGLSHAELAQHRKLPLGTVKAWIRRSLLALRACLSP